MYRIFNPKTDILQAEWSPFQETKWILPLQAELSGWRKKMEKITKAVHKKNPERQLTFILDFPGKKQKHQIIIVLYIFLNIRRNTYIQQSIPC